MRTLMTSLFIALGVVGGVAAVFAGNNEKDGGPKVTHTAVINTSMGEIEVELYGEDAPKTVANFVGLSDSGFYKDILFHRVVPGFVIQAGDPKTKDPAQRGQWGTGGGSIYGGNTFEDELNPNTVSYQRGYVEGVLAMANRGPNTNTSQFFIMLAEAPLPKAYTIFGKVIRGIEVVHAIENVPLADGGSGQPKDAVKILGVTVKKVEAKGGGKAGNAKKNR